MATRNRGNEATTQWHGRLSRREIEVLALMAAGRSRAEIAAELYISEKAVDYHAGNVFLKTRARNAAEAVARGYHAGLLVPDEWPPRAGGIGQN